VTSLKSLDDGRSSRTSSFGSQAECEMSVLAYGGNSSRCLTDRDELEKERNVEREREWNKRHPTTSRPTSSLGLYPQSPHRPERTRTLSHPSRPDSDLSHHTFDHHRKQSFSSGRSSSPSSSVHSRGSENEMELEIKHEIEHVRERNWNAPRPKWDPNNPHRHGRSVSPLPSPSSPRVSTSHMQTHTHSDGFRAGSPGITSSTRRLASKPSLRPSSSHSSLNMKDKAPRAPSPLPRSAKSKGKQPAVTHLPSNHGSRSSSPLHPVGRTDAQTKEISKGSASSFHFGWQFPRNKNPLPPLDSDQLSPDTHADTTHSRTLLSPSPTPSSRPTSRASPSVYTSHIPVRSPHVSEHNGIGSSGQKRGHKRNVTELSEPTGRTPPRITQKSAPFTQGIPHQDSVKGMSFGQFGWIIILLICTVQPATRNSLHLCPPAHPFCGPSHWQTQTIHLLDLLGMLLTPTRLGCRKR
jgi:hypothetical protein